MTESCSAGRGFPVWLQCPAHPPERFETVLQNGCTETSVYRQNKEKNRLAFCKKKYKNWTAKDCETVLYSSELTSVWAEQCGPWRGDLSVQTDTAASSEWKLFTSRFYHGLGIFSAAVCGGFFSAPKLHHEHWDIWKKVLQDHLIPFMQFHRPPISFRMDCPAIRASQSRSFWQTSPLRSWIGLTTAGI